MPFFGVSPLKKFTPKTVKLTDIYARQTGLKQLSPTAKNQAREALAKAGYSELQASKIITENQALPVSKIKEVMGHLNRHKVSGFENNPEKSLAGYLRHEGVKKKNIAERRQEYMLESMKDDFNSVKSAKPTRRPSVKLPY